MAAVRPLGHAFEHISSDVRRDDQSGHLWHGQISVVCVDPRQVVGVVHPRIRVFFGASRRYLRPQGTRYKETLAYHSIENIGIILMGIGLYLIFTSYGFSDLALLALSGGLFHTLNHALFKSLLFLSAGSVVDETGTRNIEEMGGLIKAMPYTGILFLIGSVSIAALPPSTAS